MMRTQCFDITRTKITMARGKDLTPKNRRRRRKKKRTKGAVGTREKKSENTKNLRSKKGDFCCCVKI